MCTQYADNPPCTQFSVRRSPYAEYPWTVRTYARTHVRRLPEPVFCMCVKLELEIKLEINLSERSDSGSGSGLVLDDA